MTLLAVNRVCHALMHDKDFRARMQADPRAALQAYPLSDAERAAILAGDVATLYRLGANAFLMGYLARFEVCGLTVPIYGERIRRCAP